VLNTTQKLSDTNFSFGANMATGLNLNVSKRSRLFLELGWITLLESRFNNFGIETNGYSLSGGITY
ncbi:MAG: hypothetical protein ACKO96_32485, partial [Flammeovirgaceae bacterium]